MAATSEQCKQSEQLSEQQSRCLSEVRRWVEEEVGFKGRTDDHFLLMFLFSCEFDVELTKTTMNTYYESRRQTPQWWANKSLKDTEIREILNQKLPKSSTSATTFDSILKAAAILKEVEMRRRNCWRNGVVVVGDCADYPWWFLIKFVSPSLVKDFVSSFYLGLPVRVQTIVLFNASSLVAAGYRMVKPWLSESVQKKIHICGYNLSELHQFVPKELLPFEYGGYKGSLEDHEEQFLKEVLSYTDYFEDDNQYGFKEIDDISDY